MFAVVPKFRDTWNLANRFIEADSYSLALAKKLGFTQRQP